MFFASARFVIGPSFRIVVALLLLGTAALRADEPADAVKLKLDGLLKRLAATVAETEADLKETRATLAALPKQPPAIKADADALAAWRDELGARAVELEDKLRKAEAKQVALRAFAEAPAELKGDVETEKSVDGLIRDLNSLEADETASLPKQTPAATRAILEKAQATERSVKQSIAALRTGIAGIQAAILKIDAQLALIEKTTAPLKENAAQVKSAMAKLAESLKKAEGGGKVEIGGKEYDAAGLKDLAASGIKKIAAINQQIQALEATKPTLQTSRQQIGEKGKLFEERLAGLEKYVATLHAQRVGLVRLIWKDPRADHQQALREMSDAVTKAAKEVPMFKPAEKP